MIVGCPRCGARYKVGEEKIPPGGATLRCTRCSGLFRVRQKSPAGPPAQESARWGTVPAQAVRPAGTPIVLVAHDSEAVRRMIADILSQGNLAIVEARDGVDAFMQIQRIKPAVAVLDVALPKMFGFEICEVIKREEGMKGVKVVLLASAYDRTRLRRRPENLYGADGYLEKHEIQTGLLPLVQGFILRPETPVEGGPAGPPSSFVPGAEEEGGPLYEEPPPSLGEAAAPEPEPPPPAPSVGEGGAPEAAPPSGYTEEEEKELEKARRLARIIVSDIALYNKELVEEGVRTGQFYELLERDVREGRELYAARIPSWIQERTRFLEDYLSDFIESKKKEIGLM